MSLAARQILLSTAFLWEASVDIAEELTETRLDDDNRLAVLGDSTNGSVTLNAVAHS